MQQKGISLMTSVNIIKIIPVSGFKEIFFVSKPVIKALASHS